MEIKDLIQQLQDELNAAYVAADDDNEDEAREYLKAAKQMLDDELGA